MRSFSQMLQNLKASESATYDAILETVAYIHSQYHAGRVVDGAGQEYWPQFVSAIQTKWIAAKIGTLKPSGKKIGKVDADDMALSLAPKLSTLINGQKDVNVQAQLKRAARKQEKATADRQARIAAYETAQAIKNGTQFVFDDNTLILARGSDACVLTEEEFSMLVHHLEMFRARQSEKDVTPPVEEQKRLVA